MTWAQGDLAWYQPAIGGGYGYEGRVPVIYLYPRARRAAVNACLPDGTVKRLFVDVDRLSPRHPNEAIQLERFVP